MENLIKIFIDELKAKFPQINVHYYHNESDDQYIILHDNKELEYDNFEFYEVVGELISRIFHKENHYNMVFDYDYFGEVFTKNNKNWMSAFENTDIFVNFKVNAKEATKTGFKDFKSYINCSNLIEPKESRLNLNAKSHENKGKKIHFTNYKGSNEGTGNIEKFVYPYSEEGKLVA